MINALDSVGTYSQLQHDISFLQTRLNEINRQISTGRELLTFSSDISASFQSVLLQKTLDVNETFASSIGAARTRLESIDNALSDVNSIVVTLNQSAINMGSDGVTAESRLAEAEVVSQNIEALVDIANTKIAGLSLFSGFSSSQNPFVLLGNEVLFRGDANEISAQVAEGQFLGTTLDPNKAFGTLTTEKEGVDLNTKLSFGGGNFKGTANGGTTTTIVDTNLIGATNIAAGMEVFISGGTNAGENQTVLSFDSVTGTITVDVAFTNAIDTTSEYSISQSDPAGTFLKDLEAGFDGGSITITTTEFPLGATVDLSGAETLSDAKKLIENSSPLGRLTVSINAAGNGITVTDSAATSLTIANVGSGTAVEKLFATSSTSLTGAAGVIAGGDLNPKLTEETPLSLLAGAVTNPLPALGSIHVDQGSRSGSIDLSSATTVGELFDLIENAETSAGVPYHLKASIDSDTNAIVITSQLSGAAFSISNAAAGDTTAQELGLLTMEATTTVSSLRNGNGLNTASGTDFSFDSGGVTTNIDLSTAVTVGDIINLINTQAGAAGYTASLDNVAGNSIQITNAAAFSVLKGNSNAHIQLGLQTGVSQTTYNTADVAALETNNIFSTALDLLSGLQNNNQAEILLTESDFERDLDTVLKGRAIAGSRANRLDLTENFLAEQNILTAERLSGERDVDLTEKISELQSLQVTYQAVLATTSNLLNLSLINFI